MGKGRRPKKHTFELADDREPWDLQPGETPKSFAAFEIYRDMGANRSLAKTAKQIGRPPVNVEKWSAMYAWGERTLEWDRHLAKVARDVKVAEVERLNKEMAKTAEAIWKLAAADLPMWHKKLQEARSRDETLLPLRELRKVADTGMRLHRLLVGEAESRHEMAGAMTFQELVNAAEREDDS